MRSSGGGVFISSATQREPPHIILLELKIYLVKAKEERCQEDRVEKYAR